MVCKSCNNEIPSGSVFCMYCGERQMKERKRKGDIKVPTPKQLPSGSWTLYLRAEGQSVTEATKEKCVTKAKAIRAGFLEEKKKAPKLSLDVAMQKYIDDNRGVLSPTTIEGYEKIMRGHFKEFASVDISSVPWQAAISEESKRYAPKTMKNAWGFASAVLRYHHVEVPDINLPATVKRDLAWLDYEQIAQFLPVVKGRSCEMAALLALHSLRRSEIYAITPRKIKDGKIIVDGSVVLVKGKRTPKANNKTEASTRKVPVVIDRLMELASRPDLNPDAPLVSTHPSWTRDSINLACKKAGVPQVGFHGLRRSFCSLAFHLGWPIEITMEVGGWDDYDTVHEHYLKLSKKDVDAAADTMRNFYRNAQ